MSTRIEWTQETWNPTRGCSKVSAGCVNCYAMRQAHRFSGPGQPYDGLTHVVPGKGPQWSGEVRTVPELLNLPLRWRKPRRVFVDSMSDLFHPDVPDVFIAQVFAIMAAAPQHTFQVLTKRPERMATLLGSDHFWATVWMHGMEQFWSADDLARIDELGSAHPLDNVWLGASVENQAAADERIPHLLQCPAAVRFLSCEPLLGPVDLRRIPSWHPGHFPEGSDALCGGSWGDPLARRFDPCSPGYCNHSNAPTVHWVIAGGESGPGARPCDVAWIRTLVEQCREAGVACFVKQLGAIAEGTRAPLLLSDPKGGDPEEWPEDLRVREYPRA